MSGKLILYIAASLDGYIADISGGIGFPEEPGVSLSALGYDDFYARIGAIVMGGKTYRQIVGELFPDAWPYAGKRCLVYSRQAGLDPNVELTQLPPRELIAQL